MSWEYKMEDSWEREGSCVWMRIEALFGYCELWSRSKVGKLKVGFCTKVKLLFSFLFLVER